MEHLLEHYRNQLGITKEQEEQLIEELRAKNPVVVLEKENEQLKKRLESTEQALLFLMDMGMM